MERLEGVCTQQTIPFHAVVPFTLQKVQQVSDERGIYITLLASDNEIDAQNDRMDIAVLKQFAEDAKKGKVKLRRSHYDSFFIATSTDGELVQTPDGRVQLYITFKAEEVGGTYYPEILHLLKLFKTQGTVPMQASVGGWITDYETVVHNGRLVRIIKKAELEHVALTPPDGAVNPRTRVIEVLVKSFVDAIEQYEKSMILQPKQVRRDEAMEERAHPEITVKTLMRDLEKCSIERRRLGYNKSDIERLYERAKQHGIAPSPLGNIIKPEIYLDYDEFADPVNYFFPLTKEYIAAGINFARQNPQTFLSLYDLNSAQRVYTNLVKAALERGMEVEFAGAPVDALLPEEIATKLKGFNQEVYTMLKSWASALDEYYTSLVSGLYDEVLDENDNYAQLVAELAARAQKFGYEPAPNAKLKPHKAFANIPLSKFADPVGYLFPTTPEWVIHSYRAFRYTPVRKLYSETAQRIIYDRILKGLERIGALIPFDPTFELNKHFARRSVFIGNEDFIAEQDDTLIKAFGAEAPQQFAFTHSSILVASQLRKAIQEDTAELEQQEQTPIVLEKSETASDATSVADAPKFPFVIGAKFRVPKKPQIGVFTVHPGLVKLYPDITKKSGEIPGLGIIAGAQLVRKLGLENISDIVSPKEIKLRWVGPEKVKTPIAIVDGKGQGGKETKDKVPEVGFKVVGALQALSKGNLIAEWIVLSNGTVIETDYIGWHTPTILRKDNQPVLDIARHIADEIKRQGLASPQDTVYVNTVGMDFAVWGVGGDTFITPIKISDDGRITVYPVKIPAVPMYVPAPDVNEEVGSHLVQAFLAAVASKLGEEHEWVKNAQARYAATTPEGEEVEEPAEPEPVEITAAPPEEEEIPEEEVEERAPEEVLPPEEPEEEPTYTIVEPEEEVEFGEGDIWMEEEIGEEGEEITVEPEERAVQGTEPDITTEIDEENEPIVVFAGRDDESADDEDMMKSVAGIIANVARAVAAGIGGHLIGELISGGRGKDSEQMRLLSADNDDKEEGDDADSVRAKRRGREAEDDECEACEDEEERKGARCDECD